MNNLQKHFKMALTITEGWIKKRVNLKHENFDDIKSLSLPGSYEQKIANIGTSLQGFNRLKNLDLSRNLISSLDGIRHLLYLEKLNLYYNKINSFNELFKLRSNKNLLELDVRLNPVTKSEPDYRLFLLHMLPKLKSLDGKPVQANERKAALMNFTGSQAFQFDISNVAEEESHVKYVNTPRADLIHSLARPSVLEDDDAVVLGLIAQPKNTLHQVIQKHHAENYSEKEQKALYPTYPIAYDCREKKSPIDKNGGGPQQRKITVDQPWEALKPNKYCQSTAYSVFTPNPQSDVSEEKKDDKNVEMYTAVVDEKDCAKDYIRPKSWVRSGHDTIEMEQLNNITSFREPDLYELLERLVVLVEKHWNGPNSLKNNRKFQDISLRILSSYLTRELTASMYSDKLKHLEEQLQQKEVKLKEREDMLKELQVKTSDVIEQYQVEIEKKDQKNSNYIEEIKNMKEKLEKTKIKLKTEEEIKKVIESSDRDMKKLQGILKDLENENITLKSHLEDAQSGIKERQTLQTEYELTQERYRTLHAEKSHVEEQCQQQISTLNQLQELTSMLQESHRSLVLTNDHLLQELDDDKQRHKHEVHQLHWSYEQLKRTCEWIPTTSPVT